MNYKEGEKTLKDFTAARDFGADIIIIRLVENCPSDSLDNELFKKKSDELKSFLDKSGNAQIIITTGFWRHPLDTAIEEYAKEKGFPLVLLGDLGEQNEMKALGLFWHEGVANHPCDLGMLKMAERIFSMIEIRG